MGRNGRNGKSLMGIPLERELVTKLGMGTRRNGNRLHGSGRDWECKKHQASLLNMIGSIITGKRSKSHLGLFQGNKDKRNR